MFSYKYDFSIVMGYYNRKPQLINTLNYFENNYSRYNYEVIIVDDNSTKQHKLDDLEYSFPLKIIRIDAKEKGNRINPCVTYNKGFREASGKMVIIQNPECIHIGDILKYTKEKLTYDDYIAFSCYNCSSQELTNSLLSDISLINDPSFNAINKFPWYNHPAIRPVHYHFCAAIMNDNLKILGGFNEEFAKGHSYDDNEILLSIWKNLNLNIKSIDPNEQNCFVIHQWHPRDAESKFTQDEFNRMLLKNKKLYTDYVMQHDLYNFNFPKLLHLYWDGSNFSFLNLLTVLSFMKYHKGWKINIFKPLKKNDKISWKGPEQKDKYIGNDYFYLLYNIPNVQIHIINTNNLPFHHKDASEVIKSDYFRLYVLNKFGGLWSDFDIIYTNNIEYYYSNKNVNETKNAILYRYKWEEVNKNVYPVGLFLCKKNNNAFTTILDNINMFYNKDYYQCLGTNMFESIFERYKQNDTLKSILMSMNIKELYIDNADCYLKVKWNQLDIFYKDKNVDTSLFENKNDIIGIHWFNGAKDSKDYCNNLDLDALKKSKPSCLIDKFVKQYI